MIKKFVGTARVAGSDDGDLRDAKMESPAGICVDPNDDNILYLTANYSVIETDLEKTSYTTFACIPDTPGTGTNEFGYPSDIVMDSEGNLKVCDNFYHIVYTAGLQ